MNVRFVALVALVVSACADTGQRRVEIPLFVAGTDVATPFESVGSVPVTLDRADLAFGPLFLCAGTQAGELCDTARLEWLDSAVVDATDPARVDVGALRGVTGRVQSWMYDLGIASVLTSPEPVVLDAAETLGGASFVVSGTAEVGGFVMPFRGEVIVAQGPETELGVPVVRKSTSDVFDHEVAPGEPGLTVRFDAAAWVRRVDFRPYVENTTCAPGGNATVCAGMVESTCDAGGNVVSSRDCTALAQVCVAAVGCADAISIEPGTVAHRTLSNALVSGARPAFEWEGMP